MGTAKWHRRSYLCKPASDFTDVVGAIKSGMLWSIPFLLLLVGLLDFFTSH